MPGFDQVIIDYICKKLQEGVTGDAIMEEITDSNDPLFTAISGDMSVAAALPYACEDQVSSIVEAVPVAPCSFTL